MLRALCYRGSWARRARRWMVRTRTRGTQSTHSTACGQVVHHKAAELLADVDRLKHLVAAAKAADECELRVSEYSEYPRVSTQSTLE